MDLTHAAVLTSPRLSRRERNAVALLVDEIAVRAQVRLPVVSAWPSGAGPLILAGRDASVRRAHGSRLRPRGRGPGDGPDEAPAHAPEGYLLRSFRAGNRDIVLVSGHDERGLLFGIGRLLRSLDLRPGAVTLATPLDLATSPRYPLRGHQIGYRDKTNSYCGWDLRQWEQYVRDLAVFGANAVEIIPPRSDDEPTSAHFPQPPLETMAAVSRIADDHNLALWIWFPALDPYQKGRRVPRSTDREWREVFEALPRIDAIFIPGGDPGDHRPADLFALAEKQKQTLARYHPRAQMWLSPQGLWGGFEREFFALLAKGPDWLDGVVFGPQIHHPIAEFRRRVPERYPVRDYPDITHSLRCQYPVPGWDLAHALTACREGINPRPADMAAIARLNLPHTIGAITYSEGCNDDVNKAVWSALMWDPAADVTDVLRDYGRYFVAPELANDVAQGLLDLERNWRGPLLANDGVRSALLRFEGMERAAPPRALKSWRFQMALYRAYYDAFIHSRLRHEKTLEQEALDALRQAQAIGSLGAVARAHEILDRAVTCPVATELRTRVFALAEGLYQSVHMQLSVPLYRAQRVERGANLDNIDLPLNNREWLAGRFARIRSEADESIRLSGVRDVLDWEAPGPGGRYADLGSDAPGTPVLPGLPYADDPAFVRSPHRGFVARVDVPLRISWQRYAAALGDTPLRARFTGLDPSASYRLRVVYPPGMRNVRIRLDSANGIEIHGYIPKPWPVAPVELDLPPSAICSGALTLVWRREPAPDRIGNGRGCDVAEVWLFPSARPSEASLP